MGNLKYRHIILLTLIVGILFSACKDYWADHNAISDPILTVNLLEQINKNPDLSTFSSYLVSTGYDSVIAATKTFTIWAPTNLALQSLDPAIVSDAAKLKSFVANHISNQSYFTSMPNPVLTIRTLNGKNILFSKAKFEEANIVAADRYVGNGVLHTIDKGIIPKLNAWEYLNIADASLQKTFFQSQTYIFRDSARAEVIGVDPKTGIPILKEGTGYFQTNKILQQVANLADEDAKFVYVILNDAGFNAEKTKLSKYFKVNNPLATAARNTFVSDSITNWNIVKDLAFQGDYTLATLPDTLTSNDSIRIHLDKTAVVESIKVSNGVVFIMNRIDYKLSGKIKPVIIQGEDYVSSLPGSIPYYNSYLGSNGTRVTNTRRNPNTGIDFREMYIYNTGVASFWTHYLPTVNTGTYKVYWVAVRDFDLTTVPIVYFSQRLAFGTIALLPAFPYKQIGLLNYGEVYLGDYTVTSYGRLDTFLVGFTTTGNGTNSLVLDYIKMVPVTN